MNAIAASAGAGSWACQPHSHLFRSLKSNIALLPSLIDSVPSIHIDLSIEKETSNASPADLTAARSPIALTERSLQKAMEVLSILEDLSRCGKLNTESKTAIKLGVGGVVWEFLTHELVLESLQREKVVLVLALDAGFPRSCGNRKTLSLRLISLIWNIKNFMFAIALFCSHKMYSNTQRMNIDFVCHPVRFGSFVQVSSNEFTISYIGKSIG